MAGKGEVTTTKDMMNIFVHTLFLHTYMHMYMYIYIYLYMCNSSLCHFYGMGCFSGDFLKVVCDLHQSGMNKCCSLCISRGLKLRVQLPCRLFDHR